MDSNPIPPASAAPPPLRPPPPPLITASAPPPRKRSWGWMIFALILLVLLILSLFMNLTQWAGSFMRVAGVQTSNGGPRLEETVLEDNSSFNKIVVLDVDGIITGRAIGSAGFSMVDVLKA